MEINEIWEKGLSAIEALVGGATFELWFKPIRLVQVKDGTALLEIPNRFFKEWLDDYHPALIADTISSITGHTVSVKFNVAEKQDSNVKRQDTRQENRRARLAGKGIYLTPKYTFRNFVVGPSNQFAQAAAKSVAESPGTLYNPMFIYGGVGLGKTHLINAIGNYIVDRKPEQNIIYCSSEQFTNEVIFALRHDKAAELKRKYRSLDVLLMDDVQFFEKKEATQEELFYTLNVLYDRQKQIVLTSDRPPREIKSITDRLRSRFSMGLIADIQPPETETKVAIILKKADNERMTLPEDVVYFLATKIKSNIRDLEGCMIRLGAHSSITGTPINLQSARIVLADFINEDDGPLTVETVAKTVAEYYGIKFNELKAKRRTKDITVPRQIAMYISRELTEASLSEIGKTVGGKDHATVIYACKQVQARRGSDENYNRIVDNLIKKLET